MKLRRALYIIVCVFIIYWVVSIFNNFDHDTGGALAWTLMFPFPALATLLVLWFLDERKNKKNSK